MLNLKVNYSTIASLHGMGSICRLSTIRERTWVLQERGTNVTTSRDGQRIGMTERPIGPSPRPVAIARSHGPALSLGRVRSPLALTLIAITVFLPEELSFEVFGLRLTATRVILLALAPVVATVFAQKMGSGRFRFVLSDIFVVLLGLWMIYAPANIDGIGPALNHAGPLVLEFCVGYFATRTLLSNHGEALAFMDLLCRVIAIIALLAILDPLTGQWFIHALASQLTGIVKTRVQFWIDTSEGSHRFGLLRATSTVEHPIFLGWVCTVALLIAISVPIRARAVVIMSSLIGAILAFSAAPLQAMLIGFALLVYSRISAGVPFRWLALMGMGILGVVAAFLISNSPLSFVIRHLTFDPSTGYYREWVWRNVIAYVEQSPWYGLGFGPYPEELNVSIDSLWLVQAMLFGVPGAVLLALSMIGAGSLPVTGRRVGLNQAESRLGTTLGILIFLILYMSFTVDLWGSTWILSGLIIGARVHLGGLGRFAGKAPRIADGQVAELVVPMAATAMSPFGSTRENNSGQRVTITARQKRVAS